MSTDAGGVAALKDALDEAAAPTSTMWRWSPTYYAHLPGLRKDWQKMPPPSGHREVGEIEYA